MGLSLITAILVQAAAPIVQVDIGRVNLQKLPALQAVARSLPTEAMVTRVEDILASGQCSIPGQSARSFDITVPYAVLVEPNGQAHHVVVGELSCAPLEAFVGEVVLTLARQGDFRPSAKEKARWYGSEINFNLQ